MSVSRYFFFFLFFLTYYLFSQFVGDVYCEDGLIKAVGASLDVPEGARVIDAKDRFVMPGGIDTHTHCQLPFMGTVAVDDFNHGTRAAVAGGTTMLCKYIFSNYSPFVY